MADVIAYACPACGQAVEVVPAADVQYVTCPSCGDEFTVPAADVRGAITRDDELDGLRIRQLATARRAAYRARSYAIIAAVVCLVAAGQFIWNVAEQLRHETGSDTNPLKHIVLAVVSIAGFAYFGQIARRLHHEVTHSIVPEPATPPDFTDLGDGSDAWKKLDDVS